MKKQLLFLCLFCALTGQAQQPVVFCPPGAKWHYNFYHYNIVGYPNNPHYVEYLYNKTIEYIGDTVIDNEPVKILHQDKFNRCLCGGCYAKRTFVKQHGDTIFIKNSCLSSWQILYNFAANVGEQWTSFSNTVVDSVTTTMINGLTLKQLHITWVSGQINTITETITERIGGAYFFPLNSGDCDGDNFNNFLCYGDNVLGLYQENEKPCDYTYPPPVGILESTIDDI